MITVKDIIERTKYNFMIENSQGAIIYSSFEPEYSNLFNDGAEVLSLAPDLIYTKSKYIKYIKIIVK